MKSQPKFWKSLFIALLVAMVVLSILGMRQLLPPVIFCVLTVILGLLFMLAIIQDERRRAFPTWVMFWRLLQRFFLLLSVLLRMITYPFPPLRTALWINLTCLGLLLLCFCCFLAELAARDRAGIVE